MTGTPVQIGPEVEVIHPGHGEAGDIVTTYLVLEGAPLDLGTPIWDALIAERGPALVLAADDVVEAFPPGAALFQDVRS